MRNPLTFIGALGLMVLAGCTVKNTEAPPLSGPSTFGTSITLQASPDSILQDGRATSTIRITVFDQFGKPKVDNFRAAIYRNGVAEDFGTIVPKTFTTDANGTRDLTYTAPPAPRDSTGTGEVVTISVDQIGGDDRGHVARQVDIRLVPPGVILPPNGAPVAAFNVSPPNIPVGVTATFDASASTDEGVPCGTKCTYSWNFGDGTTGAGIITTHQFRTSGSFAVTLTVTDDRFTSNSVTKTVAIATPALPDPQFDFSPSSPSVDQTIFFNASRSTAATDRTIVSYDWDFGLGTTGTGVTVSKAYGTAGTYTVTLKVTDDIGAAKTTSQPVTVGLIGAGLVPTLVVSPTPVTTSTVAFFDASGTTGPSPIANYTFNYGDGTPEDSGPAARQSHQFTTSGTFVVRVTVRDTAGRVASTTLSVAVSSPGPVPLFTFLPASPSVGANVVFNASSTTGPSPITNYAWNFGDGTPAGSGQTVTHPYGAVGAKVVTLTVTDSVGRTASLSQTVTVVP